MKNRPTGLYAIILFFLCMALGCSSSKNGIQQTNDHKTVYLNTDDAVLESSSGSLSDEAKSSIYERTLIDSVAHVILSQLIRAYPDNNIAIAEDSAGADFVISIHQIKVAKRGFTVNFLHPGPIYLLTMHADVIEDGELNYAYKGQTKVNMAWELFGDEASHWLSSEEKNNPNYQVKTVIAALRRNYYDLYIDFLKYNS